MASVSLCMIVKNEEKVLARCLNSVACAVDEIIIADTGSIDATKRIASEFTDKIFDFEWKKDFSAARNFSFSKAECDYILWLDADDVFAESDLKELLKLKSSLDGSQDIVMLPYYTALDGEGKPEYYFYRERLIRSCGRYFWEGRVHEAIDCFGNIVYGNAAVTHLPVKKEYGRRNLEIYEYQKSLGEPFSPRDTFYYGRELYYHKYYDKAKEALSSFLDDENGWTENKIEACKILSYCYEETQDYVKSFNALTRSLMYAPPNSEICCLIGNSLMQLSAYKTATFWFEEALARAPDEKSGAFISKDYYGYIPSIQLAVCYDKLKNYESARLYNEKAGKFKPYSEAYLHNKQYFDSLFNHSR